jgi:hypothetical protein
MELRWTTLRIAAVPLYLFLSLLLIAQHPGLYYDESLLVSGGVHLTHSSTEFPLEHAPHSWICGLGPCFPLMAEGRYIGPIKEYLAVPLFRIFGPQPWVIRLISVLLGAIGICGFAKLLAEHAGPNIGAIVALALAINPTYLAMNTFDNGAVGAMIAAFGLFCISLGRYICTPGAVSAALLGASVGFGVWTRANFAWLIAASIVAALSVFGRRLGVPAAQLGAAAVGGIIGAFPFLAYQVLSRGGTWEATNLLASQDTLHSRLFSRAVLFAESLLTDREHRAMWGNAMMPSWQRWTFVSILAASCITCLLLRQRSQLSRDRKGAYKPISHAGQMATLTLLFLIAPLFLTRMDIAEHHLVATLPLAIATVVIACASVRMPALTAIIAALYVASAAYWQSAATVALARTGGIGPWSDATYELTNVLKRDFANKEIKILGWGFEHNLYVLSDAKLNLKELFWSATGERSGLGRSWSDEIRKGGVFLVAGPENRQSPDSSATFLAELNLHPARVLKAVNIAQRSGATYAQILEIQPDTEPIDKPHSTTEISRLPVTAADFDRRAAGFHDLEQGSWRWTKKNFSVRLAPPAGYGGKPWLSVTLFVPEQTIAQHRSLKLTARADGRDLASETYNTPGEHLFERPVEPLSDECKFDFEVDNLVPPRPSDPRPLGIVISEISLKLR